MKFLYTFFSIIILSFFTSCGREPLSLNFPKTAAKAEINGISEFAELYADSISQNSKTFFRLVLKKAPPESIVTLKYEPQTRFFAKWGMTSNYFYLRWISSQYIALQKPLNIPTIATANLANAANSSDRTIAFSALHFIGHFPVKEFDRLTGALANLFTREKPSVPETLFRLFSERGLKEEMRGCIMTEDKYPFLLIDSLLEKRYTSPEKIISLPPLYQWDYFTRVDSLFENRQYLSGLFLKGVPEYASLYWRVFHYHGSEPLKEIFHSIIPDTLWKMPIPFQNEILIDMMDEDGIEYYSSRINSWLADTTLTLYQKKRVMNYFPESVPEDIFPGLYRTLDHTYLQNKALTLISRINSPAVDSFLLKELRSQDDSRIAKAIYVLGFRKSVFAGEAIKPFLNSRNELIRFNANAALERIAEGKSEN